MRISAVFIAYNEQESVEDTLQKSVASLQRLFDDFEIIVVNDGSSDKTGELLDLSAQGNSRIRIIHHKENLGIGQALINGLKAARFELVVHNGMDYCFDLDDLAKMVPLLDGADVVVCRRKQYAGYTKYRRLVSWVNLLLLRTLFRINLRDLNFTQLYKKQVLDSVRVDARSGGFLIPEILIRAHDLGFRLREIDIEYHARQKGVATAGRWKVLAQSLYDMVCFWVRRLLQKNEKKI